MSISKKNQGGKIEKGSKVAKRGKMDTTKGTGEIAIPRKADGSRDYVALKEIFMQSDYTSVLSFFTEIFGRITPWDDKKAKGWGEEKKRKLEFEERRREYMMSQAMKNTGLGVGKGLETVGYITMQQYIDALTLGYWKCKEKKKVIENGITKEIIVDSEKPLTLQEHIELTKLIHVYKNMYPNKVVDASEEVKPMSKRRARMIQQMGRKEKETGEPQGTINGLPIIDL